MARLNIYTIYSYLIFPRNKTPDCILDSVLKWLILLDLELLRLCILCDHGWYEKMEEYSIVMVEAYPGLGSTACTLCRTYILGQLPQCRGFHESGGVVLSYPGNLHR
jgi:hypothetical protein